MNKRLFIVRPFGTQEGIDFDAVEANLIQPAVARVKAAELREARPSPSSSRGTFVKTCFASW